MTHALAPVIASLRVRNFRLFAIGQLVSLSGTWLQITAQDWLVLGLSDDSATALGLVTALQFSPVLLLTLYGGVLADRFDKRRLLLILQTAMMVLAATLGLLVISGRVELWHVYVFAALLGVAQAVEMPTRQSFVSELVGVDNLPNAVALNAATFNLARISGPALAGVLIAVAGTGGAFLINALSFVAVLAGLLAMRPAELQRTPKRPRTPGQLREGLAYVRHRPDLLLVIALVSVLGTLGMNFVVTLPLLARVEFGVGPASFGLLTTAFATGALIGALAATRRRTRPTSTTVLVSAAAFGVMEIAVGFAPSFWVAALLLVPTGGFLIAHNTAANARVQLGADPALRGRVMALFMLVFLGGTPIGSLVIGAVSGAYGAPAGLVLGGSAVVVAAAVLAVIRSVRRHEETVPDPLAGDAEGIEPHDRVPATVRG